MLGVDHSKRIHMATHFPTITNLGTNCCCMPFLFFVGNKLCCIVLHCNIKRILSLGPTAYFTDIITVERILKSWYYKNAYCMKSVERIEQADK